MPQSRPPEPQTKPSSAQRLQAVAGAEALQASLVCLNWRIFCKGPWCRETNQDRGKSFSHLPVTCNTLASLTQRDFRMELIPDVGEQALDFRLHFTGQREQRQTRRAAEVAVKIHGVL